MDAQFDSNTELLIGSQTSPIFIGGQRRSGTTLMRSMLNRHPHIACVPESHFFQEERFELLFSDLLERHSDLFERLRIGATEMDHAVAAFIDNLLAPLRTRKGAHRWAEKSPENILRIDYLFRLFPDARFIHMVRDPRDTLCSMKQQARTYKPRWVKFNAEVTAPEWVQCIRAGLRWRECPDRYLEVHYEQMAREPETTLREVLEFLGEPWCDTVLDASADSAQGNKGGNDHKPVFTSSIGRWVKELGQEEIASIEAIAGESMTVMGYALKQVVM
jgi:protein-tyrosine sulfotransferase